MVLLVRWEFLGVLVLAGGLDVGVGILRGLFLFVLGD